MIQKYLKDDTHFLLFSEIYDRYSSPKSKREALNILNSAIEVLSSKGFDFTTLTMIAKHSGASSSKILYYFDNLDNLKLSTIKYTRFLFQSYVVEKLKPLSGPDDMFSAYFDSCVEWPQHFQSHTALWISFLHLCSIDKRYRELNNQATLTGRERLTEIIRLGQKMGVFSVGESSQKAVIIHTLVTGLLLTNATEENDKNSLIEAVRKHCSFVLTDGCLT